MATVSRAQAQRPPPSGGHVHLRRVPVAPGHACVHGSLFSVTDDGGVLHLLLYRAGSGSWRAGVDSFLVQCVLVLKALTGGRAPLC